jgi:hypothetical protein
MSWTWQFETRDGAVVAPEGVAGLTAAPRFTSQSDAESWVGEVWRDLLASGVDQVSLIDDGTVVYGPMSLHSS